MAIFNALTSPVLQTGEWECSAATLAWMLDSAGRPTSQDEAVTMLGPRISPDVGLLDATGAGLVEVLRSTGFSAHNTAVGYDDILGLAGSAPIGMGGIAFNHWVGVRGRDGDDLTLANPSPGYKNVAQRMTRQQFADLGPFYAVEIDNAPAAADGSPTAGGSIVEQLLGPNPNWLAIGAVAIAAAWALDLI